jgi:hypothetical protein
MELFGKDTHAMIAERTGKPWVADAAMYAALFTLFAGALGVAGGLVYATNIYVVQPMFKVLPGVSSFTASSPALVSTVTTAGLLLIAAAVLMRQFRRWENRLFKGLDYYFDKQKQEIHDEHIAPVEKRLKEIESRLKIGPQRRPLDDGALSAMFSGKPEFAYDAPAIQSIDFKLNVLRIEAAKYGFGQHWRNVTNEVQRLVVNDQTLEFKVRNENLGGDPFPSQAKKLEITYSINGITQQPRIWDEKSVCKLP